MIEPTKFLFRSEPTKLLYLIERPDDITQMRTRLFLPDGTEIPGVRSVTVEAVPGGPRRVQFELLVDAVEQLAEVPTRRSA